MSDRICFVLPSIVEKGLLQSDTGDYSLVMYPRAVALTVGTTIVDCLATAMKDIKLDTRDRINFTMEFLGVALATPMNQVRAQIMARNIYAEWIHNPDFMGDLAAQNRYFRKIIRHLSQPFLLEGAGAGLSEMLPHFLSIFEIYRDLRQLHSDRLEEETWMVLLSVVIGIADHLLNSECPPEVSAVVFNGLKAYSIECCFMTFFGSKTKSESIWETFHEYGRKWSRHETFVSDWGQTISKLFDMTTRKIYGLPQVENCDPGLLQYAEVNVFVRALDSMDLGCANLSVKSREYIAETVWNAAQMAVKIAHESTNGMFALKFPADSFLKLFGPFISFFPKEDAECDAVVAINLKTLCLLVKEFDLTNCTDVIFDLISGFLPYIRKKCPNVLSQFVAQSDVFFKDKKMLPIAVDIATTSVMLPSRSDTNPEFLSKLIALTLTQFSVTKKKDKVEQLAEWFWSANSNSLLLMEMLGCTELAGVNPSKFLVKELEMESDGHRLSVIAFYLASSITVSKLVNVEMLFAPFLRKVCEITDISKCPDYDVLAAATLQLLYNVAVWRPQAFNSRTNVELFFRFYQHIAENICAAVMAQKSNKGETWIDRRQVHLRFLADLVLAKLNVHFVRKDYVSRTIGDERNINESSVIKDEHISNPKITYATVRENNLLSFIEGSKGELYVICRGSFGKSVWQIITHDDGIAEPVIQKEQLTPLTSSSDVDLLVRKQFSTDYERWLNWETFNFGAPDYTKTQCRRSRTADFLICGGIVDTDNSKKIRLLQETEQLKKTIQEIDELVLPYLTAIPVIHLTDTDTSISDSWKNRKQVSPSLVTFLRLLGEPMVMPHNIAQEYSLPKVRTSVPSLYGNDYHLLVFLTPAMAQDDAGAQAIAAMASTVDVVILFNECGCELVLDHNWNAKVVIEVKPVFHSLFCVSVLSAPSFIFKPVSTGAVVDASSIRTIVGVLVEQMLSVRKESAVDSWKRKYDEILKRLKQDPVSDSLASEVVTKCAKA